MSKLWSKKLHALVIEGIHDTENTVTLDDNHFIFSPLPEGKRFAVGVDDMPMIETILGEPTQTVEALKVQYDAEIDAKASKVRARFVTPGVGQDAVYVEKERQARKFAEAGYPAADIDLPVYGYVKSEWNARKNVDLPTTTPQEAAEIILALANLWHAIAANIEEVKVAGKRSVDATMSAADAKEKRDLAIAVLDLIGPP